MDEGKNEQPKEVTGAWINEAREIPKIIFDGIDGRINQYPPKRDGGATWGGIVMDTTPCDTDHWLYKLFVRYGGITWTRGKTNSPKKSLRRSR